MTGSELLALLLEAMEIKMTLGPNITDSLKVRSVSWGIYSYMDQEDNNKVSNHKIFPGVKPLMTFIFVLSPCGSLEAPVR